MTAWAYEIWSQGEVVMAVDTGKLEEFPGRFIAGLGTTVAAGSVVIGHRLGCARR